MHEEPSGQQKPERSFEELLNQLPDILYSRIKMDHPNQLLPIYSGEFVLRQGTVDTHLTGSIDFQWFPSPGARFRGEVLSVGGSHAASIHAMKPAELWIDDTLIGKSHVTLVAGFVSVGSNIEGSITDLAVTGDRTIAVNKIAFAVPNLREFDGEPVRYQNNDSKGATRNRMVLENDDYKIILDKDLNFKNKESSLNATGGYHLLYSGELTKNKGSLALNEVADVFQCLSNFLSFLNGRRTSPLFRQGVVEDEVLWCDYSSYFVDMHKSVSAWPQQQGLSGLNDLWRRFSKLWKEESNKDFLISAIHWYVEANSLSGFTEGSIVMAQTALELIYNWLIVEKNRFLKGKDAEGISAANKIRLLLAQLRLDSKVPSTMTNLYSYVDSRKQEELDGPEIFVQIRNAIIHSQEEKRKKIGKLPYMVKYEALQISIWYIELSLLYILGFSEKYHNRCSGTMWAGAGEEYVPWSLQIINNS